MFIRANAREPLWLWNMGQVHVCRKIIKYSAVCGQQQWVHTLYPLDAKYRIILLDLDFVRWISKVWCTLFGSTIFSRKGLMLCCFLLLTLFLCTQIVLPRLWRTSSKFQILIVCVFSGKPRDTCYIACPGLPELVYSGYRPHAYPWDDFPPLKDILNEVRLLSPQIYFLRHCYIFILSTKPLYVLVLEPLGPQSSSREHF